MLNRLINCYEIIYCAEAECVYLLIWEKLSFALGGKELIFSSLFLLLTQRGFGFLCNQLIEAIWKLKLKNCRFILANVIFTM